LEELEERRRENEKRNIGRENKRSVLFVQRGRKEDTWAIMREEERRK